MFWEIISAKWELVMVGKGACWVAKLASEERWACPCLLGRRRHLP